MISKQILALGVTVLLLHICSGGIPPDIKKCRAGDVECIARTINFIVRKYPNGNEELGLSDIEPIRLNELVVSKADGKSGLQLDFKLIDLQTYGLSQINITKIVGFEKDIRNSKFEVYGTVPLLTLRGKYRANGKILLLPISGNGTAEIRLKNFKTGVKVKLNVNEENGKQWASLSKIKVQTDPEQMTVKLENLFNGNKELGDEINAVANKNWKDIWTELESGISEGYKQIIFTLISNVLKTISYDEFFSD